MNVKMKQFVREKPLISFFAVLTVVNMLTFALFFIYYPLNVNHSIAAKILYYVIQTLSALVTFSVLASVSFCAVRKSFVSSLPYAFIASGLMLIPNLGSNLLTYGTDNAYRIIVSVISGVGTSVQYAAIYIILSSVIYASNKKFAPTADRPSMFCFSNGISIGCFIAAASSALFRLIFEAVNTVKFIVNDRFGIMFFEDWLDIILSYVFIVFTLFVSYFALVYCWRFFSSLFSDENRQ